MKNVWKLSNYLFAWQWKKWNKWTMLVSGILAGCILLASSFPGGNPDSYEYYARSFYSYDMIIDQSLLPILFCLGLAAVLVGIFVQIKGFSNNAKGIYSLFLLPMKRREVFLSFLLSAGAAVAVYYLLWLILLVAAYFPIMSIYESKAAEEVFVLTKDNILTGMEISQNNGFFLAFRRSIFLGTLFPSTLWDMVPMLGGLVLLLTGIFFAAFYVHDIGLRVIGSLGAILMGGYFYLYEGICRTRGVASMISMDLTIGGGIWRGLIGFVVAGILLKVILQQMDERTDL